MDLHRADVTLEDVAYYSQEEIEVAEESDGFICHQAKHSKEEITDIIIAGHDDTFIRKHGISCDFKWMLKDQKDAFLGEMDNVEGKPMRQDYRSLAYILGILSSKVQQIEAQCKDRQELVTEKIIKHWCDKTGKRITFQLMLTMVRHPGLVGNQTATLSIETALAKCGHKVD